jgi:hypothetical protein
LAERSTDNRKAEGSNPFRPTLKVMHLYRGWITNFEIWNTK